ncbi:MAG TPA: 16S rRNA (guanine(527)-N(7))-methyltransferase RsmG [Porticoccaceae bacterium]|nr:16S rRNA (guanine(527)-N(7))-methyltransferase RsmG [Gammaproteobacteria bacterium]HIL61143.1 16S rRNA (guanine(527)-N(7))-methyltransferase RsmG [Porticoccaceae bacterium]
MEEELRQGLVELGLFATDQQLNLLLSYLLLLDKWNASFNLSGVVEINSMVSRHLLDSLAINAHLQGSVFVDIGSGAGLPGIPLAILNPENHFILVDSNGKKTRFLFQAKTELGLANIDVENCRIEHYQSTQQIDMVMCRAFSALGDAVSKSQHLLEKEGKFLAMKGRYPEDEIAALPNCFEISKTTKLEIPGNDSERHLIEVVKKC